jgi:hypothetical protein
MLESYWAGYLAALAGDQPELAAVVTELAESPVPMALPPAMVNTLTGEVTGHVVQAGHIEGGVRFN